MAGNILINASFIVGNEFSNQKFHKEWKVYHSGGDFYTPYVNMSRVEVGETYVIHSSNHYVLAAHFVASCSLALTLINSIAISFFLLVGDRRLMGNMVIFELK